MNIYVGNLSWNMTSEDLENLFTPFGSVASAKIVTDKFNNNRSKGFGFVEMANDDEARAAIAQLHDTEVLGRNIVVNESTPRPEGERSFTKKPYGAWYCSGAHNGVLLDNADKCDPIWYSIADDGSWKPRAN